MLPLWDANPPRRMPVATAALIAVNAVVFYHEVQLAMSGRVTPYLMEFALVPRRMLANGNVGAQWLTLLTHMFLHGGVAHLLGNCWFLWVFGRKVEDQLGPFRFLLLYGLAGLAAAAAQLAVTPDSAVPMLGASGAISGVLGARPRVRFGEGVVGRRPAALRFFLGEAGGPLEGVDVGADAVVEHFLGEVHRCGGFPQRGPQRPAVFGRE